MKKKILLLTCAAIITLSQAMAADVTVQDAQNVAINLFKVKMRTNAPRNLTANLQYTRTESDNTVDFYVFNMSPVKGFAIISATDNDMPVIGYSMESAFPDNFSKIGLNEWLNRWGTEIHYVKLHNVIATPKAALHWAAYRQGVAPASAKSNPVAPFCPTTWDQNTEYQTGPNLYNNFCPGGTGTNQAVTGCVATAMAQIMRYWKYPARGINSSSYDDSQSQGYTSNYGVLSANYADSVFDWANMPAMLTNTSSTTQINAVGMLMSCAGISVDMDYSPTGSGASVLIDEAGGGPSAQYSYVQFFGYQDIIEGIGLSGTSSGSSIQVGNSDFIDSIETDLNAGRLVEVEGSDQTYGGHTWVCDGYDANDNLHMNWGWSGYADGYFAITSMNPNAGSEQLNFTQDIGVLTHIMPPVQTTTLHEQAAATLTGVCPGSPTQLSATTHTNTTYSWTPTTALSNPNISNPVARPTTTTTYTVTADSAGVTATSTVIITVHQAPTAAINTAANPTCFGANNGSATVTVTGGTSGYSFHWSNGSTVSALTNLGPATYTVTVTDANSCTGTATKTLTQPTALSASTTNQVNATCGPTGSVTVSASGGTANYRYLWSNGETTATASNLAGATYDVTVTDAHSCTTTAAVTITSTSSLNLSATATNVLCFGNATGSATATATGGAGTVSYHWSNGASGSSIQNIDAATYNVTVSDGSGCSITASVVVGTTSPISLVASSNNATCFGDNNGSAQVNVSGGTPPYSYNWSSGATTATVSNLIAGNYSVTLHDNNGCTSAANVAVAQPNQMVVTTTEVNATGTQDNGSATVSNVSGAVTPCTYYWSNGGTAQTISNLGAGNYTVTVTDHNGCTQTASDFVNVSTGINSIVNAITFTVYPNPAGSYTLVQLDEFNSATTLNLKNILGQTVIAQTVTAKQTQLDLSTLANGVYLVELRMGDKTAVKQLVIAK